MLFGTEKCAYTHVINLSLRNRVKVHFSSVFALSKISNESKEEKLSALFKSFANKRNLCSELYCTRN